MNKKIIIILVAITLISAIAFVNENLNNQETSSEVIGQYRNETKDLNNTTVYNDSQNTDFSNEVDNTIEVADYMYNAAQNSIENAASKMQSGEIGLFNSTFENYEGVQEGPVVKSLINKVNSSNLANSYDENRIVAVEYDGIQYLENVSELRNVIKVTENYEIILDYSLTTGYIEKIIIKNI